MTKLTYTIVNAQVVTTRRDIVLDDLPASVEQPRTVIEAAPVDKMGKTFSAVLPADALADFVEGSTLTLTLEAVVPEAPAATETEN